MENKTEKQVNLRKAAMIGCGFEGQGGGGGYGYRPRRAFCQADEDICRGL